MSYTFVSIMLIILPIIIVVVGVIRNLPGFLMLGGMGMVLTGFTAGFPTFLSFIIGGLGGIIVYRGVTQVR